ncbi:MAG: TPM domain-containing protein [Clostridia bacterium]|nr:TPM domain-containing protein [Clostridia bacterium]
MKRKLIYILIIVAILMCNISATFATNVSAYNYYSDYYNTASIPEVDSSEKVYDYADLFTYSEEEKLFEKISDYIDTYNIDMAIVTIDENPKSSSQSYAESFYTTNDMGIGDNDDGILFLIDMDNRNMWIATHGSAISIYDSYIDPILDDCYFYISDDEYYECAMTFIDASASSYKKNKRAGWIIGFAIAIGISVLAPTIFCLYKKSKHKVVRLATHANLYMEKSTFQLTKSEDRFSHSHTSRVAKSTSSSSRGGSGGRSFGGGGRSF